MGGKDLRARLGPEKTEALWAAHKTLVPESADFVMYWWDHAAGLLTRKGTVPCAGLVLLPPTRSLRFFSGGCLERHHRRRRQPISA